MQHQLDSRIRQIEAFIARAQEKEVPDDIRSSMARFGAVLVCGFVERSVEIIIIERLGKRAQDKVLNFIRSHFKRGTNYNCEAIKQLLSRFDSKWYNKFCSFVEQNEDTVVQISSAYDIRNSVAHGGSNTLTIERLRTIFESSKTLVNALSESTK